MTVAKQLTLMLVKEIIASKQQQGLKPDYALASEINDKVKEALNALVSEKTLSFCLASVNKTPAFFMPGQKIK